jgi:hypothetical protein
VKRGEDSVGGHAIALDPIERSPDKGQVPVGPGQAERDPQLPERDGRCFSAPQAL